jgi:hypothetical protein
MQHSLLHDPAARPVLPSPFPFFTEPNSPYFHAMPEMPELPSHLTPHPLWTVVALAEHQPPRPHIGPSADHALYCSPSSCATLPSGAGSNMRCSPCRASPRASLCHTLVELTVRRQSPSLGLLTSDHCCHLTSTSSHCCSPCRSVTPTFCKNKNFVQIGVHIKMHIKL